MIGFIRQISAEAESSSAASYAVSRTRLSTVCLSQVCILFCKSKDDIKNTKDFKKALKKWDCCTSNINHLSRKGHFLLAWM